jgi:RNA polymerase sigma factor (sigma-70 family)
MMQDISGWIRGIRRGQGEAQQYLWEHYFPRVLVLATRKMGRAGGMADAEDVAASVLGSLLQGARAGRFSLLNNRNDLWALLFAITQRKVISLHRYDQALKRSPKTSRVDLDDLPGDDPPPEFEAVFEDLIRDLFARLPNDDFRRLARLRLEGWTNLEIADRLDISVRTVGRKLELIEAIWDRCSSDAVKD